MFEDQIKMVSQVRETYADKFMHQQPTTPIELIKDITNQIQFDSDASVLVMFTIEWALYLKHVGYKDITVAAQGTDAIAKFCQYFGFKYINLDEKNNKMKFDVVVGNPPYQLETNETRQREFYQQFVYKAHAIAPTVGMVIPSRWTSVNNAMYKKFSKFLINNGLAYFKWLPNDTFSVQMATCYFITDKRHISQPTMISLVDGTCCAFDLNKIQYFPASFSGISLIEKLKIPKNIAHRVRAGSLYENQLTEGTNKIVFRAGKTGAPVPYYFGSSDSLNRTALAGKYKVVVSRNGAEGKLGPAKPCDADAGVGFACFGIEVMSQDESVNLANYLSSNIVKYIVLQYKQGTKGNSKELFSKIPEIDFTRAWTDTELYAHFNLTQDEIDLIESTVK